MKTLVLVLVVSIFTVSGWALAAQKTEQKKDSSMMEPMMKEGAGEKSHRGMMGMMGMMKMMEHCAAMMESSHGSEGAKETPKK
jgi:hypothetical protein